MSVEADLISALRGHAPLTALVANKIDLSLPNASWRLPYVIANVEHAPEYGLDGTLHGDVCTCSVECWAPTVTAAEAVANAAAAAVAAQPLAQVTGRSQAFDAEVQCFAAVLTVSWIAV